MKLIFTLIGIALIIVAVVYLVLPADQLPSFMPGHVDGLARVRMKHGVLAGGFGVVFLIVGWFMGRRG
jgi:amino acid permease